MACASCAFNPSLLPPSATQLEALHSLLRVNSIPPPSTEAHFRHVVESGPVSLTQYDEQIEALREKMDRLSADRKLLATYIDASRSLLTSDIRRLPTELLADIIEMCAHQSPEKYELCNDDDTEESDLHRLAKSHLLDLSKVCARWHAIIMNTPRFWSTIAIDAEYWTTSVAGRNLDLLQVVLLRSGTYPLDLEIAAATDFSGEIGPRVLTALAEHSSRWRRALFIIDTVAEQALASVQGRLPLLETLELQAWSSLNLSLRVFYDAPRLREFTFSGDASSLPELTWSQLDFFRFCMRTTRRGSVADNRLEMGRMLDRLTLLNLSKFIMHPRFPAHYPVWNQAAFSALAARSAFSASLTFLSIICIISDAELLTALRELPNLESLVAADLPDSTPISDSLLLGLAAVDDLSQRLALTPKLGELQFASSLAFTDASMTRMVDARAVRSTSQDRFTISLFCTATANRTLGKQLMERISQLEENDVLEFDLSACAESSWNSDFGIE
ncbi:hypothetical protein C8F01DRAFT_1372810 [Mycena amicta]|nr:hypothetical protein C8F01DRAFT_1372810 [Mycena amicta]